VIQRVLSVSGKTEPCEWVVDTNHGRTTFVLKSEEDVHRISTQTVNILDANGMRYRVENLNALDRKSKAFIEWYV
jgi:pyrimidine deaminase RibD-like protein